MGCVRDLYGLAFLSKRFIAERMTKIHFFRGDLPSELDLGPIIAVDTEAMGLNPVRDALCVVQISRGDGEAYVVQLERDYNCPNLKSLLSDPDVLKIFHFARFDLAMMQKWLGITCAPVWCTKIASKLARTYTDRHGLKDVTRELIGQNMDKSQQSSDWGSATLSEQQLQYAASDVLHLHEIRAGLMTMLEREGRTDLAEACFAFLPRRAELDLCGWENTDIFAHS